VKKLVVLAAIAAALYYFAWPKVKEKINPRPEDKVAMDARLRSEAVLSGMAGKSNRSFGPPEQYALSQWAAGKIVIERDQMETYSNQFDKFRDQKGLWRTIGSYEVLGVNVKEGPEEPEARVRMKIDGADYIWIVQKGRPIRWADGF
jgi:hypothetical protein